MEISRLPKSTNLKRGWAMARSSPHSAITSLTVHAYFSQRIENIVTDMEQCFSMVETAAAERDGMNKEEAA